MKLFIFLLFVGVSIGSATILERIPDYLRQLCPKSNACDVNDYMGDKIGDPDSCCTDCSCKQECADNGNCCFVSRTKAPDPSSLEFITPIATIEDDRVRCLYPVTHESKFDFWDFFSYNMLSFSNGKNASNENRSCADQKVAPWGSLYPVYSKHTDKIYINDICAKEYNVTDGVLWTSTLTCDSALSQNPDIAEIFSFLEKGRLAKFCRIYFTYHGEINDIRSHVCFKYMIDHCRAVEFQVPSYLNASHCRPVLCPSAQIRNANAQCVFPAKVWYRQLYSIAVELRSEQKIDLKEAFYWQDNKSFISDIQPLKLSNSMKIKPWTVDDLLYESKQIDTSRTTNTLVVILSRKFDTSDPADIIRNMSLLMNTKWLLPYMNESLLLKPSQFKLRHLVHDQGLLTSGRFKVNDSYSEIYLSYKPLYTSGQPAIQSLFITKLYFCDQVELRTGEYIISTDQTVIYNTFSNNYLFDGEFDFNYGISDVSVKICYENSGFVKSIVACANAHSQSAFCCLYLLQVLLCFVFLQRHCTF